MRGVSFLLSKGPKMSQPAPTEREELQKWLAQLRDLLANLRGLYSTQMQVLADTKPPKTLRRLLTLRALAVLLAFSVFLTPAIAIVAEMTTALPILAFILGLIFAIPFLAIAFISWVLKIGTYKKGISLAQARSRRIWVLLIALIGANLILYTLLSLKVDLSIILLSFGYGAAAGLIMWLLYNLAILAYNAVAKRVNSHRAKRNAPIEERALTIAKQMNPYAQKLVDYYGDSFPQTYLDEMVVDRLVYLVSSFRANTLTDALNLYEEEQHRLRLEQNQHFMMLQQQQIRRNQSINAAINTGLHLYNIAQVSMLRR